jgi:RHH-type proline utilization regulon transcriptional repressor/proline dehydrogenase/delta 1-pyrroline-5-carboxylate dehydrogenase
MQELLMSDPALRAALFRFVDVRPACTTPADVTRHLNELLAEAEGSKPARRAHALTGKRFATRPVAAIAATGVKQMAQRFIVGADAKDALPAITGLWKDGVDATVDLLGEATVTEHEADAYMRRCEQTLRALADAARKHPGRDVNLSVKVSALTPLLRNPMAPERGIEGARPRLRHLLQVARDVHAHLHVDMESFDTREAITRLTLDLLSEPEFANGPSAGIVLQAYLVDSPEYLDELIAWAERTPGEHPFTIRLVKGAYWDHEVVQAAQNGWTPPVFTDRRECDRNFEKLTKVLIDNAGTVKVAIASHNLRSIAAAAAYADAKQVGNELLEFQILRGLGDDTQAAIAATGRRVRCYCPVGDLVAGMAYLVRRLLENTANDSFLAAHASGITTAELLEAP